MWAAQFNNVKRYFYSLSLSFCLTICLYVPPPISLNIISCKYENRQRLQFTIEFAEQVEKSNVLFLQDCADTVKAKPNTSEYGRRLSFFAHQTGLALTF